MREALLRAWRGRGPLAAALLPLAGLYRLLHALHRGLYRAGLRHVARPRVPVVVVGNVVAGGAGKTPVVIALVEHLRLRGIAAGVVSRGYGRVLRDCREVQDASTAAQVGDEPLLIHRRTDAPVFVAPRRADAVHALLQTHPATQVVVSDDGLQHHALARDVEICVFDERGLGNGWPLPAGPLREPWPRPVDFVLCQASAPGVEGFALMRRLADAAVRADGTRVPLEALQGRPFTALAGIAKPQAFFDMLAQRGLAPQRCIALADHADLEHILLPEGELLCTEKDAVKLWRIRPGAWAVPLEVEIEPAFWQAFDRLLGAKLSLSSRHGSQTA